MNPLIDQKQLMRFAESDRDLISEMAVIFKRSVPGNKARLQHSVAEADPVKLLEISHQLKGQLSYFFCAPLVSLAGELEEMGMRGTVEDAQQVSERLISGLDQLLHELSEITGLQLDIEEE
ncbi:MAG: Hpt domain-containing protein [Planctomycetota bacterium]